MSRTFRLGTRASQLALTQSRWVATALEAADPDARIELVEIRTTGDVDRQRALAQFSEVGIFTKQLQSALLDQQIDIAVHSLKDLPTVSPAGLLLAAVPEREDPSDVLVTALEADLADLPDGTVVGTGSPRRRGQLAARYPGLRFSELRGNIDTRMEKVRAGDPPAAILARAGLARVGRLDAIREVLGPEVMVPAPGQGALGIEVRVDDSESRALTSRIECSATRAAVTAERELLRVLEGGCRLPLGALATLEDETLHLRAILAAPDGSSSVTVRLTGPVGEPHALGAEAAQRFLQDPAGAELVARLR